MIELGTLDFVTKAVEYGTVHKDSTYTRGHLQTMWTAEGGGGGPKMSMFVHMGGGGV